MGHVPYLIPPRSGEVALTVGSGLFTAAQCWIFSVYRAPISTFAVRS